MNGQFSDALRRAMGSCRRVWFGVAAFSSFLNLLMLAVPLYMMQIFDRVLATGHIDTLLVLTTMVAAALIVFGLLDALRGASWPEPEHGSRVSWAARCCRALWPTRSGRAAACRRRVCTTWRRYVAMSAARW